MSQECVFGNNIVYNIIKCLTIIYKNLKMFEG